MNPLSATTLIIVLPMLLVLIAVIMLYKRNHSQKSTRNYLYLVLAFVLMALYYITAPDPEVVEALFISNGNYETPIFWSIISAGLLFVAIFYFKKHSET